MNLNNKQKKDVKLITPLLNKNRIDKFYGLSSTNIDL